MKYFWVLFLTVNFILIQLTCKAQTYMHFNNSPVSIGGTDTTIDPAYYTKTKLDDDLAFKTQFPDSLFEISIIRYYYNKNYFKNSKTQKKDLVLVDSLTHIEVRNKKNISHFEESLRIGEINEKRGLPVNLVLKDAFISEVYIYDLEVNKLILNNVTSNILRIADNKINEIEITKCNIKGNVNIKKNETSHTTLTSCNFDGFSHYFEINISETSEFEDNTIHGLERIYIYADSSSKCINMKNNTLKSKDITLIGNHLNAFLFNTCKKNVFDGDTKIISKKQSDTKVRWSTDLYENSFLGDLKFIGFMPKSLHFDDNSVNGILDFGLVNIKSKSKLSLFNSNFNSIIINGSNFTIQPSMNKWVYVTDVYRFIKQNKSEYYKNASYNIELQLIKLLRHSEIKGSKLNKKLFTLQLYKVRYFSLYRSSFFEWIYYVIQKAWWNFGFSKYYIFFWLLFFLSFFTLINYIHFEFLNIHVYRSEKIFKAYEKKCALLKGSAKSGILDCKFEFALYYTMNIFFGLKLENSNFTYKSPKVTFYIYLIYTTGLTCTAFLVNYIIS